ncbi:MAG: D-glycerate dehydrogenase [Pseudolabrys sp.]|nr:D-glycerate dehydrogenase [Pseudolabrys sp.]
MNLPRVFVTQPVAESALARLRQRADVEVNPDSSKIISKPDLIAAVARNDILWALLHDRIDKDVLDANPKLRAVNAMVITPDQIDVAEITRRKIPLTNIPAIVTDATADICFGLLIAVARRIVEGDTLFRSGVYPGSQSNHLAGGMVSGKTLGLIGAGRVGQAVARRAHGFGMKIIYADPRRVPTEVETQYGMIQKSFDDVLREADFISLHPQLAPETRHLIGGRELSLMKPTAYIINTSRGPVISEKALIEALASKKIAGAGLDVYEHEPVVAPELVAMKNVVLTPHLGSAVYELREGMAHVVVDNIIAVIEGRRPPNLLNPEILN